MFNIYKRDLCHLLNVKQTKQGKAKSRGSCQSAAVIYRERAYRSP